jgi:hypothetical protein
MLAPAFVPASRCLWVFRSHPVGNPGLSPPPRVVARRKPDRQSPMVTTVPKREFSKKRRAISSGRRMQPWEAG